MKTLITLTIYLLASVSAYADTLNIKKNTISIGVSNINFFDNNRTTWSTKSADYYGLLGSFNVSYKRTLNHNLFLELSAIPYLRNTYSQDRGNTNPKSNQKGDILSKEIGVAVLKFGRTLTTNNPTQITPHFDFSIDALYRFGPGDDIYLGAYQNGFDFASVVVQNSGIGLGTSTRISYVLLKRMNISLEASYWHVFENGKYEEHSPPLAQNYKYTPPRNMLIFQPKIGFLF